MDFYEEEDDIIRSSRSQMIFKKGVLKYFAIFTGKQSCRSGGLLQRPEKLLHRCFPVNIVKFLRPPFFTEHLGWLLFYYLIPSRSVTFLARRNYLIQLDLFFCKKY